MHCTQLANTDCTDSQREGHWEKRKIERNTRQWWLAGIADIWYWFPRCFIVTPLLKAYWTTTGRTPLVQRVRPGLWSLLVFPLLRRKQGEASERCDALIGYEQTKLKAAVKWGRKSDRRENASLNTTRKCNLDVLLNNLTQPGELRLISLTLQSAVEEHPIWSCNGELHIR